MKHRLQFAGKKLLRMALLLLGVSLVAFLVMSLPPWTRSRPTWDRPPWGSMSEEQIARLEEYWGVNEPLPQRYLGWLSYALRLDFGTSLLTGSPSWRSLGSAS